ncbi:MAG: hypothetical protein FJ255_11125 [Phycisphaerae bacterium]|nr:hypothetical protein [Phycisphaerae bacterium]
MGRAILAVIVGYIVMAAVVFGLFTGAYPLLGADGAFKPNSWEVSTTWLAASFALGLIAAVMGGLVCGAGRPGAAQPRSDARSMTKRYRTSPLSMRS